MYTSYDGTQIIFIIDNGSSFMVGGVGVVDPFDGPLVYNDPIITPAPSAMPLLLGGLLLMGVIYARKNHISKAA